MPAGRPKFEITEDVIAKVESLAATGLNLNEMADILGIHIDTFIKKRKEFSELNESISRGQSKGAGVIKNKMFEKAKDGDNQCIFMYLKNFSDLKEKQETEIYGKGGGPIETKTLQVAGVASDHPDSR